MFYKKEIDRLEEKIRNLEKYYDDYMYGLTKTCVSCNKIDFRKNMFNCSKYYFGEHYVCRLCIQKPEYDRRKKNNDRRIEVKNDRRKNDK